MNNEQCEIIRNLPYYVFNFNNNFENEICMSIISDFSKDEK